MNYSEDIVVIHYFVFLLPSRAKSLATSCPLLYPHIFQDLDMTCN